MSNDTGKPAEGKGRRAAPERITVALTPKTREALRRLNASTSLSATDRINRAINLYEFSEERPATPARSPLDGRLVMPLRAPGGPASGVSIRGHVFISYVRQDAARVDRLQEALSRRGVRIWRDTADLWPGEDWKAKIRQAITSDALVFLACFSRNSLARTVSYQNEELLLAVEQIRLRRPGEPWLIPVRFDDCDIPELDIGPGRTLASIQRVDLFGEDFDKKMAKLTTAILRILGRTATP